MLLDVLQKRRREIWQGISKSEILSLGPSTEQGEPNGITQGPKLWPYGIWAWLSFSTASLILNQTQTLDCIKCNYHINWYWAESPSENINPAHISFQQGENTHSHVRPSKIEKEVTDTINAHSKYLNNKVNLWQNSSLHYSVQCSQFSPISPKARFILLSNHGLSSLYWEVTALDYTLQLQAATHPSNSSSNIINTVVTTGRLSKKKKKIIILFSAGDANLC